MIIAGIDNSLNSPAITKIDLDTNKHSTLAFYQTKSHQDSDKFIHIPKKTTESNFTYYQKFHDHILDFCKDCDIIAFEDYSFGSTGRSLFQIAENTGILIDKLFQQNPHLKIRKYPPSSIKLFATGKGNAKKEMMFKYYSKLYTTEYMLNKNGNISKPYDDLIDSHFITEALSTEISLRNGDIQLDDLLNYERSLFEVNKRSKSESFLDQNFLVKL